MVLDDNSSITFNSLKKPTTKDDLNKNIWEAAAKGWTSRLDHLSGYEGADMEVHDVNGLTPLHHACWSGFHDTAVTLIRKHGVKPDVHSPTYGSPLCLAVIKQRRNLIRPLLDLRLAPDADGSRVGSAIHAACYTGDLEILRQLVDAAGDRGVVKLVKTVRWIDLAHLYHPKPDVPHRDALVSHCEPIFIAARRGFVDIVAYLLQKGTTKDVTCDSWTCAPDSAVTNDSKTAMSFRTSGSTLAHYSATSNEPEVIRLLCEKGVDLDSRDFRGLTPLHYASSYGHGAAVTMLLKNNATADLRDSEGATPLTLAVRNNRKEVVSILVHNGASVNYKPSSVLQPLAIAAFNGFDDCLTTLLDNNARINDVDTKGNTALLWAVSGGQITSVRILVARKAELDLRNAYGLTALLYSASNGRSDIAHILTEAGAAVDARASDGKTSLIRAVECENLDCVKVLLKHNANVDARCNRKLTALHYAVNQGNVEMVRLLDNSSTQDLRDIDGKTLAMLAAELGHSAVLQTLLERKVDLVARSKADISVLGYAVGKGDISAVTMLLKAGAKVSGQADCESGLLIEAAKSNSHDIVGALLFAGADVEARDGTGATALMEAARCDHARSLEMLLGKGANAFARDHGGRTALMCAAMQTHAECLKSIVATKPSKDLLDLRDSLGVTAMFLAARNNSAECITALIGAGASMDIADNRSLTPLMRAVQTGQTHAARLLIEAGARLEVADNGNKKALHFACEQGNLEVVKCLLAKDADIDELDFAARTPLAYAAGCGHLHVVKEMLAHNAKAVCLPLNRDISHVPLVLAAANGQVATTRTLYMAQSSVHTIDILEGALRLAKHNNHEDVSSLLEAYRMLRLSNGTPGVLSSSGGPIRSMGPSPNHQVLRTPIATTSQPLAPSPVNWQSQGQMAPMSASQQHVKR